MKKMITVLSLLLATSTVLASYPYVYNCKQSINKKSRVITVLSDKVVAIASDENVVTWTANYEAEETMDFQYLDNDVYMTISKSMMKNGARTGLFSADNALEVFNCKLRK